MKDKCSSCYNSRYCDKEPYFYGDCVVNDYKNYTKLTNAERLARMNMQELVDAIGHRSLCDYIHDEDNEWCRMRGSCYLCIEDWLES